ncbi:hypothetical protein F4677DRAFT_314022 [Hypoxylon crocopeplum]|nr:hypothetical protein F4677DRAFT_314022 [Hypoxylon crocopeplum]
MLFTNLLAVAYASSITMALDTDHRIWARANNENVVLVDCTGEQNRSDLSSEVSYFSGVPDSTPDDIAPVTDGQHRDWANKTTSAYFTDTGVTFKSVLNEKGATGDYAGTGNNGYGNFTCWQTDSTYLYSHDNKNCFVMYDCNHLGAPVTLPTAAAPGTSTTPTASTSASASTSTSSTPIASSGLSVGAIVGLSIGVAAGVLILAVGAFLLFWRHSRAKKQAAAAAAAAASLQEKGPEGTPPQVPPKGPQPATPIWQGPGARELESPQVYHELHDQYQPAEIQGQAIRGELEGTPTRAELHSHDLPPRYEDDNNVSNGAYGNFKGPI